MMDFETKEIMESVVDIQNYRSERPEVVLIPVIKPALDSIDLAIKNKSKSQFQSSFILHTNT
jgi:hypothetical protein